MTNFKTIPLSEIHPDKNQPRKYYDSAAMEELTQSIKEKGVLQPVLIRPNGNGYLLVCGERRHRAAISAGLNDIPAVIRELTDDEALELQIIENLQRKDVHPMEEAVAFKSLLERKVNPLTVEDLANRIGKKPMFIRQRVKLNSLIKPWQESFYKNLLSVTDALSIGSLHIDQQNALAQEYDLKERNKGERKIDIDQWRFKKYLGDLNSATFDKNNPNLSPKFGPCTTCPFNSAVASLFPDDSIKPVCTNIPDFVLKTDKTFEIKLKESKDDPSIVLISDTYYTDQEVEKKYGKDSQKIYSSREYESIDEPEKPDWEEFQENNDDNDWNESKMKKEFEIEVADYNKDLAEFEKKISGGKYLKGLVVNHSREKGKIVYVKLKSDKSSSANSQSSSTDKLSAADIDAEIKRINDKEKRSLELDLEKVNKNMVIALKDHKAFKQPVFKWQKIDRTLMIHLLMELAGFSSGDKIRKALSLKYDQYSSKTFQFDYYKQYEKVTDDQLAFIIRVIFKEKWAVETSTGPTAGITGLRIISEYLGDVDLKAIEKEQADISTRRNERITGRIKTLNKSKAELKIRPVKTVTPPAAGARQNLKKKKKV